jgi:hypothetical protein
MENQACHARFYSGKGRPTDCDRSPERITATEIT